MNDLRLAKNFLLSEFLQSETATRKGIDNTPTREHIANLQKYTGPGMQRVRDLINKPTLCHKPNVPIIITSGYRSEKLNYAIGGSLKSQHSKGQAADFIAPGYGTPKDICELIVENARAIDFDQLIWEGTWVHISFAPQPRGEVLTAHFESGGSVRYTRGIG